MCLALAACAWAGNQFTPLLVVYREQAGYSTLTVDVLFGVYVAGLAPGLLVGGPASDRWGRRRLLLPAVLCAALASVVLAAGAHSVVVLALGRLISGGCVGVAMAVGTTWVKELSRPEPAAPALPSADGTAARRAAVALTGGFAAGAAVAGSLAAWAPAPEVTPYAAQVLLGLGAAALLRPVPDPGPGAPDHPAPVSTPAGPGADRPRGAPGSGRSALRTRAFGFVVLPAAPWVFASAAVAYAVLPQLVGASGGHRVLVATLLCVVTLAAGIAVQPLARRLGRRGPTGVLVGGLVMAAVGSATAATAAGSGGLEPALAGACVLGLAYGAILVAGLVEVQRLAAPADLARVTSVFYALTYTGFLLPMVLAALAPHSSYALLLRILAVLAVGTAVAVAAGAASAGPRG